MFRSTVNVVSFHNVLTFFFLPLITLRELKGKPGVARSVVQKELENMSAVILEELLHPEANGLVLP